VLSSPEVVVVFQDANQVQQTTRASVHHLMDMARQIRQHPLEFLLRKQGNAQQPAVSLPSSSSLQQQQRNKAQPEPPALTLDDLKVAVGSTGQYGGDDSEWFRHNKDNVSRGVAGRGLPPAVVGAQRAHIEHCPINVDSLAYWNDPVGSFDQAFVTPFASSPTAASKKEKTRKYITFAPDRGGWNNVRVSTWFLSVLLLVPVYDA
jgi:hypothetical protein